MSTASVTWNHAPGENRMQEAYTVTPSWLFLLFLGGTEISSSPALNVPSGLSFVRASSSTNSRNPRLPSAPMQELRPLMNPVLQDPKGEPAPGSRRASRETSIWQRVNETWTWEILGFLVAALCLGGTTGLLRVFDGRQVPKWPVTLNVLLSLLGNLAWATTMFGVQASLGQVKWVCFARRPRPLAELAAFHGAWSGPFGALLLMLAMGIRLVLKVATRFVMTP